MERSQLGEDMNRTKSGWQLRRVPISQELMHQERITYKMRWVRQDPLEETKHREPNLKSIYREAMLYLKKRDWTKAQHLADKAIEKLEAGDRKDLANRVRQERDSRASVLEYRNAMEKYGGGGC